MVYESFPMKVVDLSDLQLDLANYRIPTRQEDERAALNFLWAQEDVLSLATQIIRDRYFDNEVPVVVDENGKYTVLEGNRRVAALKALHDPDGEFHDHASSTRSLLKRFATEAEDLPTAIRVLIAPDRHTVEPHIIRLHTGRAKKPWTLDQQSTYYYSLLDETTTVTDVKQMYKGVNITRMMRMASMRLFISSARFKNKKLRAYAASAELTMSALEYAYKRKDIRALFGVDFDADGRILPATETPEALGKALTGGHLSALEVLLTDFQAGKLDTRSLEFQAKKPGAEEARAVLLERMAAGTTTPAAGTGGQSPVGPGGSSGAAGGSHGTTGTAGSGSSGGVGTGGASGGGGRPGGSGAGGSQAGSGDVDSGPSDGSSGQGTERGSNNPNTKDKLNLAGLKYNELPNGLQLRFHEIRNLSLEKTPVATAMVLRAVLEGTIKHYFGATGKGTVSGMLGEVLKQLANDEGSKGPFSGSLNDVRQGLATVPGSANWFNAVTHRGDATPDADEVRQAFNRVNPILRELLIRIADAAV